MATHKYLTAHDGGYFYRFYPKFTPMKVHNESEAQLTLFNPPPVEPSPNRAPSIHGKFFSKYNDKGLTVELHHCVEILLTDTFTGEREQRILTSTVIIQVPDKIYNYPFEEGKIYAITTQTVTAL